MKILLVEDDTMISAVIKLGLERNGYDVMVVYDSVMAEKIIFNKKIDFIILDIIIPVINGLELCKKIRNASIKTPILMLTSLDTVNDKIAGLDCGADDYLVKPFNFRELLSRIKAIERRYCEAFAAPVLKIADLEICTLTKKVIRKGKEIKLTAKEFAILVLLAANIDKVFERFEIIEKIWGQSSYDPGSNVIDVHINSLRRKIDKGYSPKLIHNKYGYGFVMKEGEE